MQSKVNRYGLRIKTDTLLYILTAFFMFYGFFEPYINQVIGPIMRYYIIALVCLYTYRYQGKLVVERPVKYLLLWFAFECVSLVWTRDYTIVKLHFFTMFGAIFLLLCITQTPIDKRFISLMTYTFWIGSFLTGFLSLFYHSAYHFEVSARQVLTINGLQTDPNNQAIFLMYGISVSLYYLFIKKEKIIISLVTIIVNMISMMMTASRGSFLSFGVMIIFIILVVLKNWKTKIWAILITITSIYLIFRFAPSFVSVASLDRLMGFETYEGGGNRITIWNNAFDLMSKNPFYYLIGAGWGAYYNYNGWHGMHNTYLETFCNTGIIGMVLFYYPIVHCGLFLWKKEKYLPIFVAISVFLPALFIDCINKRFFWNAISFLFVNYFYEINIKDDEDSIQTRDVIANGVCL